MQESLEYRLLSVTVIMVMNNARSKYLKNITSDLEDYWYDLETNILKDIAERIKLNKISLRVQQVIR